MNSRLNVLRFEDRAVPAAYTLDPTFGDGGQVKASSPFTPDGYSVGLPGPVAVRSDGGVVVVNTASILIARQTSTRVSVGRYNADGTPGASPGGVGTGVVTGVAGLAVDAADRVTVLLTTQAGLELVRPGGYDVQLPVTAGYVRFAGLQALPDGSVLVAAQTTRAGGDVTQPVIVSFRVTADGQVDPAGTHTTEPALGGLGGGAPDTVPTDPAADRTRDFALNADGSIFFIRSATASAPGGVVKLRADGTLDPSFDGDGIATIFPTGAAQTAAGVFPAADGSVFVYAATDRSTDTATLEDEQFTRLTAAGAVDRSFGDNGSVVVARATSEARAFPDGYVRGDGSVVLAGNLTTRTAQYPKGVDGRYPQVAVLSGDGAQFTFLDGPYNQAGGGGRIGGSALDPAGRLVLAGDLGQPAVSGGAQLARLVLAPDATVPVTPPVTPGAAAKAPGLAVSGPADGQSGRVTVGPGGAAFVGVSAPPFGVVVRTASADLTGDGVPDLVAGAGPGGTPRVVVVDGVSGTKLADFPAYEATFTGGVFVTAGDVTGDGVPDVVVTPDVGGGPVVVVYDGTKLAKGLTGEAAQVVRYYGIEDPNFRGGARATLGDLTGDGRADVIVAAGQGGGPRVTVWDGPGVVGGVPRQVANFFALEPGVRNGVFVAAGDLDGDGLADLAFGGGPGGGPRVRVVRGAGLVGANGPAAGAQLADFFAFDPADRGGARVAIRDATGTGVNALAVGSGAGEPARVRTYSRAALTSATPAPDADASLYGGAALADGVYVG